MARTATTTTHDDFWDFPDSPTAKAPVPAVATGSRRPKGHPFRAEIEVSEIDDRLRPSPAWLARTVELSRSNLVFLSRRMVYNGRPLLIAIHLIDEKPTPLAGVVVDCTYDADGLYRIDIDLSPFPQDSASQRWITERGK